MASHSSFRRFAAVHLLAIAIYCPVGYAQPDHSAEITALQPPVDSASAWFAPDPFQPMTDHLDLARASLQSVGLSFELALTSVFQLASDSANSRNPALWSFSYDFAGQWHPFPDTDPSLGSGELGFHLEGGRPIGDRRTSDLAADIGSILGVNDDLDAEPIALTELWWAQRFLSDRLVITLGKIDPTCFYDANRIANSEVNQFLASPLVNNSAVAFPDNGLGANLTAQFTDYLYLSAGIHDAQAVATQTGFNTLDQHEFFYAFELGFSPAFADTTGNYRFMLWSNESDDQHGRGLALSFDHDIAPCLGLSDLAIVPFFRYAYTEGQVTDFDHLLSAGLGFEGLLSRPDDLLALGYVWADPVDSSLPHESIAELFYRIQLTDTVQLTPDVQCVFHPAANPARDLIVLLGVRLQMDF